MPAELIDIALSGGLNQRMGAPHIPTGDFLSVRNARQTRTGALEKRPGNSKLTNQYQLPANAGPASLDVSLGGALSSYGNQLLISCNAGTAEYSATYGTFGALRPATEALVRRTGTPLPDIISGNTLIAYSMEPAVVTDGTYYFFVYIDNAKNAWATIQRISDGSLIQERIAIRVNAVWSVPLLIGGQFTIVTLDTSGAITMVGFPAPYTGNYTTASPVSATLVASGVGVAANIDAVDVSSGNFVVAYPVSTTGITIQSFSASGANLATATTITAANVLEIRLSYENLGGIWLGYRLSAGPLFVAGFNGVTLGIHYSGPFSVISTAVSSFHLLSYALNKVLLVASVGTPFAAVSGFLVDFTSGSGVIAIAGAADQCGSTFLASKPFLQSGKYYCWAQGWAYTGGAATSSEYNNLNPAQWTNLLLDLRIDTAITGVPRPCRPVACDSPRFAYPKPNAIVGDAGLNIAAHVAPLSLISTAPNTWSILCGTRASAYITPWSRLDISFSDTARWGHASLGTLLLRSSGLITNWDGSREFENGFLQHTILPTFTSTSGGSIIPTGAIFYYKIVPMATDKAGNIHRGIPSAPAFAQLGGSDASFTITIPSYQATDRVLQDGGQFAVGYSTYFEIYRSIANPGSLGTDIATNYVDTVANNPSGTSTTYLDTVTPATVQKNALCYTFGGDLPNGCPPGGLDIVAHEGRAWVLSDDGQNWYFSKQIVDGEAVNFTDSFTQPMDDFDGVGGASMDDKLIAFTKRKIFYQAGFGPADNGASSDYQGFTRVQSPVGCIDRRSIVTTPEGVMFQSPIGIYLLDRGLNVIYAGQPVADELATYPVIVAAILHPTQPWVYFYVTKADASAGERIVYDYRLQKWFTDSLPGVPVSAVSLANGTHYWLDTTGAVWAEDTTGTQFYDLDPINFTATWVTMQFEIAWSKAAGLDGYQLVQSITILGERLSAHDLGIDWRKGYSATYERPTMWNTSQIAAQPRFPTEQFQITVGEEVQALSVRVTDFLWSTKASRPNPPADSGQGARFFGITLEVEPLDGAFRVESSLQGG